MTFNKAIAILSQALLEKQPRRFTGTWIYQNAPRTYRFVRLNHRTPTGNIDWDAVTRALDRSFQQRWAGRRRQAKKLYENREEVDAVLNKYRDKLYVFIASIDQKDRRLRDVIIIALVRIAQKGNTLARQEAVTLIRYTVDDWIEKYYMLQRWNGYSDALEEQLAACVRRYRFTGSFLGYVFKTLEYAGRGLAPTYSLDAPLSPLSEKTWAENVIQDSETGEIRMFRSRS